MTSVDTMSMTSHSFMHSDWDGDSDNFLSSEQWYFCDDHNNCDSSYAHGQSVLSVADSFPNGESDYFSIGRSPTDTENGNNTYLLHNMTPINTCDRQLLTDDDNSSVMLDDLLFLQDVDKYASLGQCSGSSPDQQCLLYNSQSYSNLSTYSCRSESYRQSFSSSPESYSNYSMSSSYNNVGQQSFMMPNLPNLRDLEMAGSPSRPGHRYSSSGDESESESEGEPRTRKGKRGSKSVLLWKFLLESLADPQYAPHILRWENQDSGVFKFVDTGAVARLWGSQKRKKDMNFEKLSRGIRHYYKEGMMNRVEGKRLVYKFNWKKVPKEYRRRR